MLSGKAIEQAVKDQKYFAEIKSNPVSYPLYPRQLADAENKPRIVIDPFDPKRVNPNSYNLRLADKLLCYSLDADKEDPDHGPLILDMAKDNPTYEVLIPEEGVVLLPGRLYLGSTMEWTETYNLVPKVDGRSSVARLGLVVHLTAGFGDINYQGTFTLEIVVVHPIRVYAGVELCQISYEPVQGEIGKTYEGKYQWSTEAKASGLHKEFPQGEIK